jgi:hypothetical protein
VHAHADPTTGVLAGPPFVLAGCYEMTMNRDTAQLQLEVKDTTITGKLRYNLFRRDSNIGSLTGVLRDSLIVAHYTFESEGLTSVREVIFKISDTTLLQAYGDLNTRGGKVVFSDPTQLQYTQANPFVKVPCP